MLYRAISFCRVVGLFVMPPGEAGAGGIGLGCVNQRPDMEQEDAPRYRVVGGWVGATIVLSFLVIVALLVLPAFSGKARQERINSIINCDSKDVQQVVLSPEKPYASLVAQPVAIDDRPTIDAICQALNRASRIWPNHPATKWKMKVELRMKNAKVSFVVLHTEQEANGTIVSIMSHVTSGWNYGSFRCDSLAPILEEFARKEVELKDCPP